MLVYVVTTESDCEGHGSPDAVCASMDIAKAYAAKEMVGGTYGAWQTGGDEVSWCAGRETGHGPDWVWIHMHAVATAVPQ